MDPADHPAPGPRAVHLRDAELVAEVAGELRAAEHFGEIASIIPVHLGGERPRAIDTKWLHTSDGIECQLS